MRLHSGVEHGSCPGVTRSRSGDAERFVFWGPCAGLQPVAIEEPLSFLIGQAIVVAISLCLLGAFFVLLPFN